MTGIMAFIAAAVIIERLVSYAKTIVEEHRIQWQILAAIAIGELLAFNLKLDLFTLVGLEEVYPIVGTVLTGILISGGSNYVFELYDRLTNWKAEEKGAE